MQELFFRDAQRSFFRDVIKDRLSRLWRRFGAKSVTQGAAEDATLFICYVEQRSKIVGLEAIIGAVCAADETMVLDVQVNGVSIMTDPYTVDDAAVANAWIDMFDSLDPEALVLEAGDVVFVDLAYTAGGAPTPLAGTHVRLEYVPMFLV